MFNFYHYLPTTQQKSDSDESLFLFSSHTQVIELADLVVLEQYGCQKWSQIHDGSSHGLL